MLRWDENKELFTMIKFGFLLLSTRAKSADFVVRIFFSFFFLIESHESMLLEKLLDFVEDFVDEAEFNFLSCLSLILGLSLCKLLMLKLFSDFSISTVKIFSWLSFPLESFRNEFSSMYNEVSDAALILKSSLDSMLFGETLVESLIKNKKY